MVPEPVEGCSSFHEFTFLFRFDKLNEQGYWSLSSVEGRSSFHEFTFLSRFDELNEQGYWSLSPSKGVPVSTNLRFFSVSTSSTSRAIGP